MAIVLLFVVIEETDYWIWGGESRIFVGGRGRVNIEHPTLNVQHRSEEKMRAMG